MNTKSNSKNRKILLVENQPQVRKIFSRFLLVNGYSVITASDGAEGLEKIKNDNSIKLVITDINMPYMDGKELLQEIKKIKPHLNSIVVSGNELLYKEKILANEIIQKPIGLNEFTGIVKRYL